MEDMTMKYIFHKILEGTILEILWAAIKVEIILMTFNSMKTKMGIIRSHRAI
jgi:hypothetical protein